MKLQSHFPIRTIGAICAAGAMLGQLALMTSAVAQDQAPSLGIMLSSNGIVLSWPATATGFVLETTSAPGTNASWLRLTNGISVSDDHFVLSTPIAAVKAFYRLHNIGNPITAPEQTWTFVPFADAFCMEGDTLGIGINLNTNSHRVLLFLNGGGASRSCDREVAG